MKKNLQTKLTNNEIVKFIDEVCVDATFKLTSRGNLRFEFSPKIDGGMVYQHDKFVLARISSGINTGKLTIRRIDRYGRMFDIFREKCGLEKETAVQYVKYFDSIDDAICRFNKFIEKNN